MALSNLNDKGILRLEDIGEPVNLKIVASEPSQHIAINLEECPFDYMGHELRTAWALFASYVPLQLMINSSTIDSAQEAFKEEIAYFKDGKYASLELMIISSTRDSAQEAFKEGIAYSKDGEYKGYLRLPQYLRDEPIGRAINYPSIKRMLPQILRDEPIDRAINYPSIKRTLPQIIKNNHK